MKAKLERTTQYYLTTAAGRIGPLILESTWNGLCELKMANDPAASIVGVMPKKETIITTSVEAHFSLLSILGIEDAENERLDSVEVISASPSLLPFLKK